MKRPDYVIDASGYPDSQELVAAADVMITDYSSIMFEPAFVRKPVFLYAPDRKEYINGERKLLIDYDTLPFSIAESNEDLANNIENFNQEEYVRQVDEFMEKYGVHEDGHASERAAKFISDLVDGIRS
ncbi:putative CDP-glycerol:glycerophosphate glycerophosphotransferase [compost metagenome]